MSVAPSTSDPRITHILDVIMRLAAGDLTVRGETSEQGDDLDGIMLGLNMLAEELTSAITTLQREQALLESRVHARTAEITLLGELGDLLQSCVDTEEAYALIGQYLQRLFPAYSGGVYLTTASRTVVEAVAVWGTTPATAEVVFAPDDCWALRRGRVHSVSAGDTGIRCRHVPPSFTGSYVCCPMLAQGEALGILHVRSGTEPGTDATLAEAHRLVTPVTDQLGLALANLKLRETLRQQSIRDALTGLFNRRYLEESLDRELLRARRNGQQIGIIMLDIDHFKRFNDTFGHGAGDLLLREVGALLGSTVRGGDIACRYGGEEFTLILVEATVATTRSRAEVLRKQVQRIHLEYRGQALGVITMSAGIACFPAHGPDRETLLNAADTALYQAKHAGRNRVEVA